MQTIEEKEKLVKKKKQPLVSKSRLEEEKKLQEEVRQRQMKVLELKAKKIPNGSDTAEEDGDQPDSPRSTSSELKGKDERRENSETAEDFEAINEHNEHLYKKAASSEPDLMKESKKSSSKIKKKPIHNSLDSPLSESDRNFPTHGSTTNLTTHGETISSSLSLEKEREKGTGESSHSVDGSESILALGIEAFNHKPKEGIRMLVAKGHLKSASPKDIATFLHEADTLEKTKLGEYLGDADNIEILKEYTSLLAFSEYDFEPALRFFLSGFRLPGEAGAIDRIMKQFATTYLEQNGHLFKGTITKPGTLHTLAFSVLMLNTDAHNPQVRRKMTRAEFMENTQLNLQRTTKETLSPDFLGDLYDQIILEEIKLETATPTKRAKKKGWVTIKKTADTKKKNLYWVVLDDASIQYYRKPGETEALDSINLEQMLAIKESNNGKQTLRLVQHPSFASSSSSSSPLSGKNKTGSQNAYKVFPDSIVMYCTNAMQLESWLHLINRTIISLRNQGKSPQHHIAALRTVSSLTLN